MKRNGCDQKKIAKAIGKHPSTVSRELRRAGRAASVYCSLAAQYHGESLRPRRSGTNPELLALAEEKIRKEQWSPQQVSGWLARCGHPTVSHETIYQHSYRDKRLGCDLHLHLRHRCKSYHKRGSGREKRGRLKDQVMIDERPAVVEERSHSADRLCSIIRLPNSRPTGIK